MSREKKKGTSGNAKAFITRARALKKLQLTLSEFRRLCILKGIYPRDPRKKLQGADKTYYLTKDIDFLAHERLISTIRAQNTHKKKIVKARAKRRIDLLKRLALSAPKSRLDHLVVERYPHFTDAIRELDDPLCIIALFANLPADHKVGIAPARVTNCQRLLKEFYHFVVKTTSLRRTFVSIKGYYFQASVCGETVTWITPHRFSQVLPADVDYSVMLTFLELYECIMAFVNFRLYTSQNLAYPPAILRAADSKALELASIHAKKLEQKPNANGDAPAVISDHAVRAAEETALTLVEDESDGEHEPGKASTGSSLDQGNAQPDEDDLGKKPVSAVFRGRSVVLGREVPYAELEFALLATGADKVTREDELPDRSSAQGYTHWIMDRPKILGERIMSLEYVQPQYVFDSINAAVLLPVPLYSPGAHLPPHLSPFVSEEDDGGYRPWFKDVVERIKSGDTSVVAQAAAVVYAEGEARAKKERVGLGKECKDAILSGDSTLQKWRRLDGSDVAQDVGLDGKLDKGHRRPESETGSKRHDDSNDSQHEGDASIVDADEDKCDSEAEEENNTEDDDEGDDDKLSRERQYEADKEGKEMATLMLSRKKMRQYKRQVGEERRKNAVKRKLSEKRKKLDQERMHTTEPKRRKRRTK